MSTRICPVCGADYLDWVETCSTCGVLLVVPAQAPDPLRLPVDQQVVYELGEWPLGMQASAAQVMAESGIPHGWDGTDLVVQLDHEATVDALLEAVEAEQPGIVGADWLDDVDDDEAADAAPATAGWPSAEVDTEDASEPGRGRGRRRPATTTRTRPTSCRDSDELEYELDEWPDDDRAELSRRLAEAGLPHRWEDDAVLVVRARRRDLRGGAPRRARVPRRPGVRGAGRRRRDVVRADVRAVRGRRPAEGEPPRP